MVCMSRDSFSGSWRSISSCETKLRAALLRQLHHHLRFVNRIQPYIAHPRAPLRLLAVLRLSRAAVRAHAARSLTQHKLQETPRTIEFQARSKTWIVSSTLGNGTSLPNLGSAARLSWKQMLYLRPTLTLDIDFQKLGKGHRVVAFRLTWTA